MFGDNRGQDHQGYFVGGGSRESGIGDDVWVDGCPDTEEVGGKASGEETNGTAADWLGLEDGFCVRGAGDRDGGDGSGGEDEKDGGAYERHADPNRRGLSGCCWV